MKKINLAEEESREILPGYKGKFIHTDNMTLIYWHVQSGAPLKEHSHVHEQVVNVLEGEYELTVEGVSHQLKKGMVLVIPSHAKHSGIAKSDCHLLDVFYPVREDYK